MVFLLQLMVAAIGKKEKRQDSVEREIFAKDAEYKEKDAEYKKEKLAKLDKANDIKAARARSERLKAIMDAAGVMHTHMPEKSFEACVEAVKLAEKGLNDDGEAM
jgi:hypothetical protein